MNETSLQICDKGIGFDQNDAERIFNVFTKLHEINSIHAGIGFSIKKK